MSKTRNVQPFIAGQWTETGTFVANAKQPEPPISDLTKMVKWARTNLVDATEGGQVAFIQKRGTLNVIPKRTTTAEFVL